MSNDTDTVGFLIRKVDRDVADLFTRYAAAQGILNPQMLEGLVRLYEDMSMLAIKQDNEHARTLLERSGLKATHVGD